MQEQQKKIVYGAVVAGSLAVAGYLTFFSGGGETKRGTGPTTAAQREAMPTSEQTSPGEGRERMATPRQEIEREKPERERMKATDDKPQGQRERMKEGRKEKSKKTIAPAA